MTIDSILAKLKAEPVRVRIYSVAALVLALALAHGLVDASDVDTYVAILGVVLGVETARAKVTPVATSDDTDTPA